MEEEDEEEEERESGSLGWNVVDGSNVWVGEVCSKLRVIFIAKNPDAT